MHLVPFACMLLTNPKHFFFQSVLIFRLSVLTVVKAELKAKRSSEEKALLLFRYLPVVVYSKSF